LTPAAWNVVVIAASLAGPEPSKATQRLGYLRRAGGPPGATHSSFVTLAFFRTSNLTMAGP
jgi:hypothetical protein